MRNQFTIIILLIILTTSCKTIKETEVKSEYNQLLRNDDLQTLQIRAQVHSDFPDMKQSFNTRINLSYRDSLQMTVLGPLNIPLGRLYADKNYFLFFNTLDNTAYEGKPTQENLKKVAMLDISFEDLLYMFRNESPADISEYKVYRENEEKNEIIMLNDKNPGFAEFIVISTKNGNIIQVQRKNLADETVFNVFYSEYKNFNGFLLPTTINLSVPSANGKLNIKITETNVNIPFTEPFKFDVPSGFNKIRLD